MTDATADHTSTHTHTQISPENGTVPGDHPALRFRGAVSVQRGPGGAWLSPWRVPYEEARLYLPEGGIGRAAMPAGVRLTFRTDSGSLACRYQADPAPRLTGVQEQPRLDVVADGRPVETVELTADGRDAEFRTARLPGRMVTVELWLPTYHQFRLRSLALDPGSALGPDTGVLPRWVHYGSSISQGRGAASPVRAWPALVARDAGLDLTSLAMGAACCLQPMTARLMRDLPAELLTACVGINVQSLGSHSPGAFDSALVGFVRTVRERHPDTPFVLMSTIVAPDRETLRGPTGMTVEEIRERTRDVVHLLRSHGDVKLRYINGLDVFGPRDVPLMLEPPGLDRLHPGPTGHPVFAERFLGALRKVLGDGLPGEGPGRWARRSPHSPAAPQHAGTP
ncbi:GDSL-type esterase/lipase family protein [Streptomyces sp. NBC_00237]|uniref:GDSL-type esterase/lipase family protein n=1 Tax=Streptomyces sp. NBC_00237 TaxID=2975687 RepID=UPI002259D9FA|nr:GDSL-type esterase/lipase family protein [Streptomyces sp. NBC_00237]MCX5202970.1 GDSL-type esterase/lipase family protein [Streptomyces sp. NBC_00237]